MARRAPPLRISALCFAGLGELARRELAGIAESDVATRRIRNYDLLSCTVRPEGIPRLHALRLMEDVFVELGRVASIQRTADLARLGGIVRKDAMLHALQVKNAFNESGAPQRKSPTFACFVKQDKDRRLRRSEISRRVETLLAQQFPRWRRTDPAQIEIWVFWHGGASLALRLSDERFKYRGMKPPRREAALRPTIAAAMAMLAAPRDGEMVLDPMCGSGTVLLEARALNPRAQLMGMDISPATIDLADARLGERVVLEVRDARKDLGVEVDCIVCNLPWGHAYAADADLYGDLAENFVAALRPGGRMVLLTDQTAALESALDQVSAYYSRAARVLVRGKWATLYTAHAP